MLRPMSLQPASSVTRRCGWRSRIPLPNGGLRGIRQVEEHWLREVKDRRAANVRTRLEASLAAAPVASLAQAVLAGAKPRQIAPAKRDGLEDGVSL